MNMQKYEEAAEWIVRNRNGVVDAGVDAQFDDWLRKSPENIQAYLEMSSIWETLPDLSADISALPETTFAALGRTRGTVVTLRQLPREAAAPGGAGRPVRAVSVGRTARDRLLALAACILAAITVAWMYTARGTYETGVGEQRSVVLEDGSRVELNSRSRLRVRYTAGARRVELLQGQAMFDVAKNRARPFVVQSGAAVLQAVGTQFDVYRTPQGTVVTVVEGKVAVISSPRASAIDDGEDSPSSPRSAATDPARRGVLIAAGEQLIVQKAVATRPHAVDVDTATAWTRRMLVFEAAPLSQVAAEFNRYNKRPLVIVQPLPASLRISGVFSSSDPEVLLRFLRTQPELSIEEAEGEIRVRPE